MADIIISDLFDRIKPYIYGLIQEVSQAQAESGLAVHDLDGSFHTGTLDISKVPDALNRNGGTLTGNINAIDGVLIDGVDLSVFNQQFITHAGLDATTAHDSVGVHFHNTNAEGGIISHVNLQDLNTGDPHTNLVHNTIARTIAAVHTFSPSTATAPFILAANAQNQLVTGLYASSVNKNVYGSNGLYNVGGTSLLTGNVTLGVQVGYGLFIDGSDVAIDQTATFDWYGSHYFDVDTTMSKVYTQDIVPRLTDTYDLGTSSVLWRKGWLSELDTIIFAQNTVTLLGGWLLITKGEGSWDVDLPANNTSFNYNFGTLPIALNDFLLSRATGKLEYFQVTAFVSGTTWTVTRDKDGSGGNAWPAGTPFAILGYNGNGRIELNAYDTPRIQMFKQGTSYNTQTELLRIGDLNNGWGIVTETYGAAFGEYAASKPNLVLDATGLRLRIHNVEYVTLDNTGAYISGVLTLGLNGGIFQGTGSFAVPTTGLKIYRSGTSGVIEGYSGGTVQAKFNSSGEIEAGAGTVKLNASGMQVTTTTSFDGKRGTRFYYSSAELANVTAYMQDIALASDNGIKMTIRASARAATTDVPSILLESSHMLMQGLNASLEIGQRASIGYNANTTLQTTAELHLRSSANKVYISHGTGSNYVQIGAKAASNFINFHTDYGISFFPPTAPAGTPGDNYARIVGTTVNAQWNIWDGSAWQAISWTPTHPGWSNVTFQNSWVNFGAPFQTVQYYKDATGRVYLRGLAKSGTLNTVLFTLPAGYRPPNRLMFSMIIGSATTYAAGRVDIESTGLVSQQGAAAGFNSYISLDGISFMTV